MSTPQLLAVILLVAFCIWYLSLLAGRLDRIHIRKDEALVSLKLQLAWRASAVAKLLTAKVLDPVSADLLADQIQQVTHAVERSLAEYLAAESGLTSTLCQVFDDPEDVAEFSEFEYASSIFTELAAACRRVELARRFHNDAVGAAQLLRRRFLVRWLRLAGHTDWPVALDMNDAVPSGLSQFAA